MSDLEDSKELILPGSPVAVLGREQWKYQDPNTEAGRKGLLLSNEIERNWKK
jgi:hypothetical protein